MSKAKNNSPETDSNKQRIDKWLWAARFYKTRRLAADAVSGGKVHINNNRAKPSKDVHIGDELSINKNSYEWKIIVLGINSQRRPAKEAILLYQEDTASIQRRTELAALFKTQNLNTPNPVRPNKKQRRQIHQFKYSGE